MVGKWEKRQVYSLEVLENYFNFKAVKTYSRLEDKRLNSSDVKALLETASDTTL